MAIRFDAAADYLSRTTGLPSISSFTIMAWVKISVDLNTTSTMWKFGTNNTAAGYIVQTSGTGTNLGSYNGDGVEVTGSAMTVGTWYHVANTVSGTGGSQFLLYLNGVLNITNDGTAVNTAGQIILGNYDTAGSEPLNGCLASCKVYGAVLTAAEIAQEMRQYLPIRLANLNAFYPLLSDADDTVDYGGSGNTFTAGGTLTTEDGPPIPWGQGRHRLLGGGAAAPPALEGWVLVAN